MMNNLDKTIKELTERLDEVHPYSASTINDAIRNDGITYWKDKKIISTQAWNDLYQKSSTYTNTYKTTLTSRKPLQYFPDDYNRSISLIEIKDEKFKEEIENWNKDYEELLEYRKNPKLGRMKCSKCLLNGSHDDRIFVGIEKLFARIVSNQCNNRVNNKSHQNITYYCNVRNIFLCPIENKDVLKYTYTKKDLFALHQLSFAIEQAITTFSEMTKQNEIIYEVDFENDRVHEIHTKYNGEPESWGWREIVSEQLSSVKPISDIVIRDEQDIYNILTNREKLESLFQEYEKENNYQLEKEEEIDNDNIKLDLNAKLKEEYKKHIEEQLLLLKENKQNIIDFIIDNKDSIRIEDLKSYEPIYKCYREKGHCFYCNTITNIICKNCHNNSNHMNNKEIWLCINHWQEHALVYH